jgi:hypothetical protein
MALSHPNTTSSEPKTIIISVIATSIILLINFVEQ